MSGNKRNIDRPNLPLAKTSQGNALPTGTGTHDRHRVAEEEKAEDHKQEGVEGRKAGIGKGHTRP